MKFAVFSHCNEYIQCLLIRKYHINAAQQVLRSSLTKNVRKRGPKTMHVLFPNIELWLCHLT